MRAFKGYSRLFHYSNVSRLDVGIMKNERMTSFLKNQLVLLKFN